MTTIINTTKERLIAFIADATGENYDTSDFSREELQERAQWVEDNAVEWYGEPLRFVDWAN